MKVFLSIIFLVFTQIVFSQNEDSLDNLRLSKMIELSEVVVRNNLDVAAFIQRVKNDTTFYKAFRNLRVLSFTSLNDIRMQDKKGKVKATLQSKTKQRASNGCRTMEKINETVTGDFYEKDSSYNYYTAELYAGLFFTKGRVCGETNTVAGLQRNVKSKKGIEKHRSEEHTSELQSQSNLVCRLLLEK